MKQKKMIMIIILIILVIGGFLAYLEFFNHDSITVGNTAFNSPRGYHENGSNNLGDIKLTNGTDDIYIAEYDNNNIQYYIGTIKGLLDSKNVTYSITNFTYDNLLIYKMTVVNDTNYIRYWYMDHGKTYCIYTWDGNINMDNIVYGLIDSRT